VARLCRGDWSGAQRSSQRAARVGEGLDDRKRDRRRDRGAGDLETALAVLAVSAIAWNVAGGMWIGSAIGGFVGMRIDGRMPRKLLRAIIIIARLILNMVYARAAFLKV
jgi:hypothetical protein